MSRNRDLIQMLFPREPEPEPDMVPQPMPESIPI